MEFEKEVMKLEPIMQEKGVKNGIWANDRGENSGEWKFEPITEKRFITRITATDRGLVMEFEPLTEKRG